MYNIVNYHQKQRILGRIPANKQTKKDKVNTDDLQAKTFFDDIIQFFD